MQTSHSFPPVLRFARNIFLVVVAVFALVGIIFLLAGWQTVRQYGNALVWAGVIGLFLVLMSAGWRNGRREENVALSQLMPEHEVFRLLNRDLGPRGQFMLVGLIALAIVLAAGFVLMSL